MHRRISQPGSHAVRGECLHSVIQQCSSCPRQTVLVSYSATRNTEWVATMGSATAAFASRAAKVPVAAPASDAATAQSICGWQSPRILEPVDNPLWTIFQAHTKGPVIHKWCSLDLQCFSIASSHAGLLCMPAGGVCGRLMNRLTIAVLAQAPVFRHIRQVDCGCSCSLRCIF